jgi:hypothetical protein
MILGVLFLLSVSAFAETRVSQIDLGGSSGPDEYQSQSADAVIGVNEEWQILGSFYRSDSGIARLTGEELISTEVRVGADWKFHEDAGVNAELIRRQDPYELYGQGGLLGGHYHLSSLWKGKRKTRLGFSLQQLRFTQDVTFTGSRASLNIQKDTSQRKGTVSLQQDITDWMEASASFSRYNYDGEADNLSLITARRRTNWGGNGPNYGQSDRSTTMGLTFFPLEWMETTVSGNRTRILGDSEAESRAMTLNQVFFWKKFHLGIEYTSTTYTEGSSGTDPSTQEFWGGNFGYEW